MADESENIEARLAAYIDGEIADHDRRDIEEYLAANPSHAKLIAELRAQRTRLATLPREKAPPEIMDHLQQHLERHALLEGGEDSRGSMRINHWPQWTAAAAMLFLAAGLGLLVYQVLPGAGRGDRLAAVTPSLKQLPPPDDAAEPPATGKATVPLDAPAMDGAKEDRAGAAALQQPKPSENQYPRNGAAENFDQSAVQQSPSANGLPAPAQANRLEELKSVAKAQTQEAKSAGGGVDADRQRDFVEQMADEMLQKQARRKDASDGLRHATLSIVSDDPAMSGALVAAYLVQNGITFDVPPPGDNVPASQPSPIRLSSAPLVIHNISVERVRGIELALAGQRSGRQQVTLQTPAIPSSTSRAADTTQPADAVSMAKADQVRLPPLAESPSTQSASAGLLPSATSSVPATKLEAATTSQPTTQSAQAAPAIEEAADLWIVITPAPPATPPPATAPATANSIPATQPIIAPPATAPVLP